VALVLFLLPFPGVEDASSTKAYLLAMESIASDILEFSW
jgi:hypothetical protein